MKNRLLAALTFALWAPAVLPAQPSPVPNLYGKIDGQTYVAPGGYFKIQIPVLPEFGGEVHDTENVVTFDDAVNTHLSIANFPLDMSLKWEFETRGARDFLTSFYSTFVISDFQVRYPTATTEGIQFHAGLLDGALLAFSLLPGGSFFEKATSLIVGPGTKPAVAKRGSLLFVRNGRIFILSCELAERVTQRSVFQKTADEENEILRLRLIELAGRMQFPVTPRAKPR